MRLQIILDAYSNSVVKQLNQSRSNKMSTKKDVAKDAKARILSGISPNNVAHLVEYPRDYDGNQYCQYLSTDLEDIPRGGTAHYRTLEEWSKIDL